mmetsp:Transcript_99889/g.258261  ORF Transcript_99889/g.258261 Transcript_99889/m.258261 type:complete len:223 (-) Transcript_99889:67-735(-)
MCAMCTSAEPLNRPRNFSASNARSLVSVTARREPTWRQVVHKTGSQSHCPVMTSSAVSVLSCLYWTSPFCTKNIRGCVGASWSEKRTSPFDSDNGITQMWQAFRIPAGFVSLRQEKKGCSMSHRAKISKWISIISGSDIKARRLTLASGMFCFCSCSACWAFRCTRTARGREMPLFSKYRRNCDISADCLLEMICRRVIAVVKLPSRVEEKTKPKKRTATAK